MESREYFDTSDAFHVTAAIEGLCQSVEAAANVLSDLIPSREAARLQLTCAALMGFRASEVDSDRKMAESEWIARLAVEDADACLALLYPEPAASDGGGGER